MFYFSQQQDKFYSALDPTLLPGKIIPGLPDQVDMVFFLYQRPPDLYRSAFSPTHPGQLLAQEECVDWLNASQLSDTPLSPLDRLLVAGKIRAVNKAHPRWEAQCQYVSPALKPGKKRVNILAMGDVGSTLALGLRLLGGDILHTIGICDIIPASVDRQAFELNQVTEWGGQRAPEIVPTAMEDLFTCDLLAFCASKSVPPLGATGDMRLAQLTANRQLITPYAKMARNHHFSGIFAVVSDPLDLLCRVVWEESNRDSQGYWDGQGLFSQQIEGYGLGVMYARAAYYASREERFHQFLTEGAAFGPHGAQLVIANSLQNYDETLSQELTELTATANLRAREMGFKPYIAPALSSAAYPILATLRGQWHLGSTQLGTVFFGCETRQGPAGTETRCRALPTPLLHRIRESATALDQLYRGIDQ